MRIIFSIFLFAIAGTAVAKSAVDKEGNCLPEVINQNGMLYDELAAMDKIAIRSETQCKSKLKESQKLGFSGFKELKAKAKNYRAALKKFHDTYGNATCKAMGENKKVMTFSVKDNVDTFDKTAAGYEKMADAWLKAAPK